MKKNLTVLLSMLLLSSLAYAKEKVNGHYVGIESDISHLERVVQKLVPPPGVPIHDQVNMGPAKVIKITMDIEEKEIELNQVFLFGHLHIMELFLVH